MGQYYHPVLITPDGRILSLYSHAFDSGLKLTEHSWIGNEFVNAAYSLILDSPKKVAWIGDYSCEEYDPESEAYARAMPLDEFQKYYDAVYGGGRESLSPKFFSKRDLSVLDYDTKRMFLVNHDKHVYIGMEAFIRDNTIKGGNWAGWCMNPLPLLTACGNGRGGGDFPRGRAGYEDIGIWAFDSLEYTKYVPKDYQETRFFFNEHEEAKVS